MAYKFQLDDAIMSGSLVQEGAAEVVGNLTTQGIISGSGTATLFGLNVGQGVFSVSNEGAAVAASLNNSSGGITNAGAIAGATSVDGSGDLTMGTITMSGFTVDADGDTVGKTLSASAGVSAGAASTFFGGCDLQVGGLSNTGPIAGATSVDGSGDLTMGTITMTGFSVDADGDTVGKTLSASAGVSAGAASTFFGGCDLQVGGLSNTGPIAGATTITSTGIFSSSATPTLVGLNVGQGAFSVAATGVTVTNALTATSAKISDLTNNRLVLAGAAGELEDNAKLTFDGADLTLGASTRLIAVEAEVSGDLTLSGTSDHAVAVAADSVYFLDATSGKVRRDTFVDLVSAIAGGGLTATAGVLSTQAGAVSGGMDGGTATEGYNYFTGTVNAAIKLPASPSNGDVVTIKAGNTTAGQNITINCQGSHLIDQDATNIHLESPYAAITLVYMRANDWRLV
tara:strand:+ start:9899 stop:11266 length:1368 start_codon:yes stop_codon:yes gene_type:complete